MCCLLSFTNTARWSPSIVSWAFPHQSAIKTIPHRCDHRPVWSRQSFNWNSIVPRDSWVCQIDHKSSQDIGTTNNVFNLLFVTPLHPFQHFYDSLHLSKITKVTEFQESILATTCWNISLQPHKLKAVNLRWPNVHWGISTRFMETYLLMPPAFISLVLWEHWLKLQVSNLEGVTAKYILWQTPRQIQRSRHQLPEQGEGNLP